MERDSMIALVQEMVAAYNAQDFDAMRAGYTDDIVIVDHGVGIRREGADAVIAGAKATAAKFPDRRFEVEQIFVDGDHAVLEATWHGTPADPATGVPEHWHTADSGAFGPFRFCRIIGTRDGRIASLADYTVSVP